MEDDLVGYFQRVDDDLNGAFESNDFHVIAPRLADDWVLLEPIFGLTPRDRFLDHIQARILLHRNMKKRVERVRLYGEMAIVTSRGMNSGVYRGRPFHAEHWVTNIYRKDKATWICVMTQEAPVSKL